MTNGANLRSMKEKAERARLAEASMRTRAREAASARVDASQTADRPQLLIIDDDPSFLGTLKSLQNSQVRQYSAIFHFFQYTGEERRIEGVHCGGLTDLISYIESFQRLDALYIDYNNNYLGHGMGLIADLRSQSARCAYIPIAIITAFTENVNIQIEAADEHAVRYMPKFEWNSHDGFLERACLELEDLKGLARMRAWSELNENVARVIQDGASTKEAGQIAVEFLHNNMKVSACYFREVREKQLHSIAMLDGFGAGDVLELSDAPIFHRDLITGGRGEPWHVIEVITAVLAGSARYGEKVLGFRALAARIGPKRNPIGVFTLYRKPEEAVFSKSEGGWLHHLAAQLGNLLAREREEQRLRVKNIRLVDLLENFSTAKKTNDIAAFTVSFLDKEFLATKNGRGKATIRTFERGSGDLVRRARSGCIPDISPIPDPININDGNSVCAAVVRTNELLRFEDVGDAWTGFKATSLDVKSCITAPLAFEDACFGTLNLEHESYGAFSDDDAPYVCKIATAVASALARQRSKEFLNKMSEMLKFLRFGNDGNVISRLLDQSANLLFELTGYSTLLILRPELDPSAPWRVDQVYIGTPEKKSERQEIIARRTATPGDEIALHNWRRNLRDNWESSHTRAFLKMSDSINYLSYDLNDPAGEDDAALRPARTSGKNRPTHAQLSIKLRDDGDHKDLAVFVLLFESRYPIAREQFTVIKNFARFMSWLYLTLAEKYSLLANATIHEQEAALGRAMGQLRHTINSKLAIMQSYIRQIREGGVNTQHGLEHLERLMADVSAEIHKNKSMVKAPVLEVVDPGNIWDSAISELAELAGLAGVSIIVSDNLSCVLADRDILRAIFFNLIDNAIRYAGSGAEVRILQHGHKLKVANNGQTMNEAVRERLFEPGATTNSLSTGLGLYLSRERMRAMGGDLVYDESEPGVTFLLKFSQNSS